MSACVLGIPVSLAKTNELMVVPFAADSCGLIDGMYIVANWRIRLEDLCPATMRSYVKLL